MKQHIDTCSPWSRSGSYCWSTVYDYRREPIFWVAARSRCLMFNSSVFQASALITGAFAVIPINYWKTLIKQNLVIVRFEWDMRTLWKQMNSSFPDCEAIWKWSRSASLCLVLFIGSTGLLAEKCSPWYLPTNSGPCFRMYSCGRNIIQRSKSLFKRRRQFLLEPFMHLVENILARNWPFVLRNFCHWDRS